MPVLAHATATYQFHDPWAIADSLIAEYFLAEATTPKRPTAEEALKYLRVYIFELSRPKMGGIEGKFLVSQRFALFDYPVPCILIWQRLKGERREEVLAHEMGHALVYMRGLQTGISECLWCDRFRDAFLRP